MADKVGSVYIEIQAKMGTLEKDLKTLETRMQGVDNKAKQTSSAFVSMGKVIASAGITGAVIGLGKAALSAAAQMEQNRVAFTTMLGSADKANKLLQEMTAFAASTPFELPEIVTAGKQMLAFGFGADEVIKNLRMLGDVSAGLSVPIGDMVYLFGQIKTQGRAMTQDLMQFANRGVPIFDELAKVMGISNAQVKKFAEEGKIGFGEIEKVFQNLTKEGSKFGGMMEAQSKTLAGQWSNFNDNLGKTAVIMGDEIMPIAKTWLELANNILNTVNGTSATYPKVNKTLIDMISPLKAILDYNTWIVEKVNEQFKEEKNVYDTIEEQRQAAVDIQKQQEKNKKGTEGNAEAWKKLVSEAKKFNEEQANKANASNDPLVNMQREIDASTEAYNKNKEFKKQGLIDTSQYNLNVLNITEARIKKEEELEKAKFDKAVANASAVLNVAGGLASQLSNLANMSASNETARIDQELTAQQDALNAQYEQDVAAVNAELITQEEKDAKLKALDEKKARDSKALEEAAAKEKRKIARENAKIQKQLAIFQVMITAPQAAMSAYAALAGIPIVGPALGIAAAVATLALGAKQIQLISEQPLPALAQGGIVPAVPGGNQFTIGEAGSAEAVIPLNDQTLGRLAGMINNAGGGGGGQPMNITLQVDGETFGKWIYNTTKNGQTIYSKNGMVA